MVFKLFFTWWNKQTFGTFLKTLFFGIYVGKDEFGNKYFKNKNDERWIIYKSDIEATKINTDWYLWMHHTVDKIPDEISKKNKFKWQKKHLENKTGTKESYKAVQIKKNNVKKKYETWK